MTAAVLAVAFGGGVLVSDAVLGTKAFFGNGVCLALLLTFVSSLLPTTEGVLGTSVVASFFRRLLFFLEDFGGKDEDEESLVFRRLFFRLDRFDDGSDSSSLLPRSKACRTRSVSSMESRLRFFFLRLLSKSSTS